MKGKKFAAKTYAYNFAFCGFPEPGDHVLAKLSSGNYGHGLSILLRVFPTSEIQRRAGVLARKDLVKY